MTRLVRAAVAVLVLACLAACNTVKGVGEDVGAAGHAVAKTAEKVKQGM